MKFAIVDIETTGLYHQGHGITEVAVVHVDDECAPTLAFHSMVNPDRTIPAAIEHMTGITPDMVDDAPNFADIAEPLAQALEDRIFVAHNVSFDYRFLEAAFSSVDRKFRHKRLCTMRYARKVIPGLTSYRLASLCRVMKVINTDPHRAAGDALATAELLTSLIHRDSGMAVLHELLAHKGHAAVLPASIDPETINQLPESPGVYYMMDKTDKPIYIGKAKNLRKRVLSHFTGSGSSQRKQLFQHLVAAINYRSTPSEHFAFLVEDAEIKKWWPRYNRAQKGPSKAIALVEYRDRTDKTRFAFINTVHRSDALAWFHSPVEGRNWLYRNCLEFGIDPRRGGLPLTEDFPTEFIEDPEAVHRFIDQCRSEVASTYALGQEHGDDFHYIIVRNGRYRGFGMCSYTEEFDLSHLEDRLNLAPDSPAAQSIIRRMLTDEEIIHIDF